MSQLAALLLLTTTATSTGSVGAAPAGDDSIAEGIVSTAGRLMCKYRPSYFTLVNLYNDQTKTAIAKTVKFQISVRYALWVDSLDTFECNEPERGAPWGSIVPWFGFTQKSIWALYEIGAPFEESNYRPELFFTWYQSWGPILRTSIGFEHESNGIGTFRGSRSWNRAYIEPKLYWGDSHSGPSLRVYPRIWIVPNLQLATNPDIADYLGYAKLTVVASTGATLLGRAQLEIEAHKGGYPWSSPARFGALIGLTWNPGSAINKEFGRFWKFTPHFYAQLFHGYGETLLRYNEKRTSIWVGFRITD